MKTLADVETGSNSGAHENPFVVRNLVEGINRGDPLAVAQLLKCLEAEPSLLSLLDRRLFEKSSDVHFGKLSGTPQPPASKSARMEGGNGRLAEIVAGHLMSFAGREPIRLVDVGCGVGAPTTTALLQRMATADLKELDFEILALDLCADVVDCTAKLFGGLMSSGPVERWLRRAQCQVGDAGATGLAADTIHAAICGFVLHHCNWLDKQRVIAEQCRIVKPGGVVAIVDEYRDIAEHKSFLARASTSPTGTSGLECFIPLQEFVGIFTSIDGMQVLHAEEGRQSDGRWVFVAGIKKGSK